ncbi:MAG: hypothetical protein JKY65_12825, partial [Planctomycetes bacterium]|nr:hypothetical protein [Planctomycetota bacterium]
LPPGLGGLGEGLLWATPLRARTPDEVRASLDALRCSRKERDGASDLVEALGEARRYEDLSLATRKRLLRAEHTPALLALVKADLAARDAGPKLSERLASDLADFRAIEGPAALDARPLISGRELSAAGLRPGPVFARILRAVADAQLEARVSTEEEALELARTLSSGDA